MGALGLYAAVALAVLPFADEQGPTIPAITPVFATAVLTAELATSFLLFALFGSGGAWSLLLLGCAYLYAALMAALHLLTFPGALIPDRVAVGTGQSAPWTFILWMCGYGGLALAAVAAEAVAPGRRAAPEGTGRAAAVAVAAVLASVLCCALAVTAGVDRLPPLIREGAWTATNVALNHVAIGMMAAGIGLALAFAGRRNALFLWLSLALAATLVANLLSLAGGGRYSVGWSAGRLSWIVSACVLLLFFMGQFARQQRLLAEAKGALERRVAERTADLAKALRQRDLLLREVHHRVKNNLQVVDSLLDMEARRLGDAETKEAFKRLRNRVFTLGLVHQQLMSSEDLETFSIAPFLRELSANLSVSLAMPERGIALSVDAEPVAVGLDFAIPVGLITTELVLNAAKHAEARSVVVEFRRAGRGAALLAVADDGPAGEALPADRKATAGLGGRIVAGLTRQLDGRMEVSRHGGTRVEIRMPLPEAA